MNVQELSAGNIQVSEGFINPQQLVIKIDPKLFLQGPYNAGVMLDGLRTTGNIPTTSPYIDGLTCNANVFNVSSENSANVPALLFKAIKASLQLKMASIHSCFIAHIIVIINSSIRSLNL